METRMALKRPRSAGDTANGAANGAAHHHAEALPMYHAASVSSGNVVVVGMLQKASLNCAGMALVRVFQGHVELLGWQPPLGTYFSVYSPKWSSLMVISGLARDAVANGAATGKGGVLDAEYQAPFDQVHRKLFASLEPQIASMTFDMKEEQAADKLAQRIAETYPIVLVFHVLPRSHGNVMCYYEPPSKQDALLPGFKIVVTKEEQQRVLAFGNEDASAHQPVVKEHEWKPSTQVLRELLVGDPSRTIHISHGWSSTVQRVEQSLLGADSPQRIVVCGGKDVGKSTFCRYLVNRLLSYYDVVAFIDTDLGQPELTPPGVVSMHALTAPLLGPGFTHMRAPLRSFFCGGTNPGTNPLYYIKAVKSLLRLYGRKWGDQSVKGTARRSFVPLVINTDGWVKSMGHDLLCSVIQDASPSHVVQLLSTTKSKQFDVPSGPWTIHSVEPWDPVSATIQAPRSSKEMRLYRLLSYFLSHSPCLLPRDQLQNLHVITEKDRLRDQTGHAFAALRPFVVSFDAVDIAFAGSSVPPSQVLFSLNCSILGLCINMNRVAPTEAPADGEPRPPRIQLEPVHAPCVGVGLVRAIDAKRRCLYVLTPVRPELLAQVNLLVRGSITLEPLFPGINASTALPFVVTDVIASEGTGSAAMQSRNNLKRKRDDKA
ncbi:hypothetical protein Poli38472_005906 [Pythium oligandrum]|uniref:Uncharacterized protein n=1 Tax=Pythium oligandrum TaxID=41045 RepID=A0A8K1CUE4_PYTOL|nr:hypothetical protein Poli38472_005906 [Pythium oligandrum]|eukprot:TMW68438.1 hypothetical protein Poli38472_005906 [Pythium oligandrum]